MVQFIQNLLSFKKAICVALMMYSFSAFSALKVTKEVEIRSEKLSLDYNKRIAEYYGNVKIHYDGTNITCDRAQIFYSAKKDIPRRSNVVQNQRSMLLDVIKFYDNVFIESNGNKAYSDYGVFTKNNNLVVLEKNVRLKEQKGYVTGSKLLYNLKTKKMNIVNKKGNKRVRAVLND